MSEMPREEVGLGPWEGEWPTDEHLDPELLREGDRRNVVDRYRYWTVDAIVADLDLRRHPFHVAIENWQHDFNIGSIVRTANAFAVAEVHIVGKKRWNRRGAMVTDRYQHVRHHGSVEDFAGWAAAEGLAVVGIDNVDDSVPIETASLERECVLVFG
ncbi:MAG: TrmH family RNA methyltransferase, partial [Aeromicrobium sp.]